MHCIFAIITPKPECFESAEKAILGIVESTRNEAGCIQFCVHTDESRTALFLYEQWHNESALTLHYEQSYTKEVFAAYEGWLLKSPEISALNLLG